MPVSIIAEVNTILITISGKKIIELLGKCEEYLKYDEDYPNEEILMEIYQESTEWEKFKKKAVENVQIYKKNNKNTGMNRFNIYLFF